MRRLALAVLIGLAAPAIPAAGPVDGLSDYQRFITYPHFQRGFAAQRRGDHAAAVAAFERARRHAPESALTAVHLADAYRRAGRAADADRVLGAQRRLTPNDPRLAIAPERATAAVKPAPRASGSAQGTRTTSTLAAGDPARPPPRPNPARASTSRPRPESSSREAAALAGTIQAALDRGDFVDLATSLQRAAPGAFPEARLAVALASGPRSAARDMAVRLLRAAPRDAALLDRVTYRLVAAGEGDLAARLLLDGWDHATATHARATGRLAVLIAERPGRATADDRVRLRSPAAVGSARAHAFDVLSALADCDAMDAAAGALPAAARAAAWMRVAGCHQATAPERARTALRHAVASGAGPEALRALAHAEFAAGGVDAALAAWSAMPVESMTAADLVAAGNTAVAAGNPARAIPWLDAYDARGLAPGDVYWWLRALTAAERGGTAERHALRNAIALREDARYLARLAQLQRQDGDVDGALHSLERAHALEPSDASVRAALGYAYLADDRPADALPHLQAYQAGHADEAPIAEDLAEVHRRLADPRQARLMARTAIDLLDERAEPDRVFRLKRLREELGRRWTLATDLTLGNAVSTAAAIPGTAYRSYAQVEAQYRLGHAIGRPDGDALAPYARVFAGAQDGGVLPDDGATLGLGLRWKPFERHLLYVAAEQQRALDSAGARDETLLRVSASPLDDPRIGRDWHPSGAGWWSHTLYLDAAHYVRRGDTALTADYQAGRHVKVGGAATIEPYARLQANGLVRGGERDTDVRVGLGARWNLWHGGDRHTAHPHRLALGVEVQQALDTYLQDRRTVFVTLGHTW